jgi:hypothetical protein
MLATYFKIIRQAIKEDRPKDGETYYEAHHIIPKSFGKKSSTVLLTADEHYRVHKILVECFKDHSLYSYKVYWAFHRMSYDGSKTLTEQEYKEAREILMPLWKRKKSASHRKNIGAKHKGRKQIINPNTREFKQIEASELDQYLSLGWINSNKSVGTKRTEKTKKLQSIKATESKLGKIGEESRASKGTVICENIETGEKIEAGSAYQLSKKLNVNCSVIHETLNKDKYSRKVPQKTTKSKYYNFLQTHKIYYK